jgi:general secretion pathway protein L
MPTEKSQAQLFGLDLGALWRDLLTAWGDMLEWPLLSWLRPTQDVRVWQPSGETMLSRSLGAPLQLDNKRALAARFEALLIPENLLLRRTLVFPKLAPTELAAALELEAPTQSPFPANELIWAYETKILPNAMQEVALTLTSRKLIQQHADTTHPLRQLQNCEVWIPRFQKEGFLVLPGYAEARRQRLGKTRRSINAALALLAIALIGALAATPTAQLYLRAREALQSMSELQKKAAPVMAQREALIHTTDQLNSLTELTGKTPPTLDVLNLITNALPDDTSLLNLKIQGLQVIMSGQTGNTSSLMKQLGNTAGVRDVKAPTPATKPLGATRESFTIELTIDPAQTKVTP